ncbi:MAG: lipid A deacylase LpxR family protein [Sulfurimonas sp.]|uniref:lipid A deacylase LpxR family protein n=1 Tax=Sulfurimonas sp. TaxID=2022749 RepID=UPI003D10A201
MQQRFKWLVVFLSLALNADQFSFSFYNDFFAGTDRHFTNGISLSWLDETYRAPNSENNTSSIYTNFTDKIIESIPLNTLDRLKNHNAGMSITQIMVTPNETSVSTPQYDDIPYAGYLMLAFYMFEWDEKSFTEYRMEVGVVGEEAGAGFAQKTVHKFIGADEPKGWDTQLGTQYTINTLFRYGEISWKQDSINGLSMDWFNHYGFQLGNFTSDVFAGTMLRIGYNYNENFNLHYPYLKEEASMLRLDKKHSDLGWSLSIGINGELLAYSYILDEAKSNGYNLNKQPINVSIYLGTDIYYDAHKLTLFYQSQSPYTYEQNKINTFGGLMYSFQF